MPLILLFVVLALTHGRYWGTRKQYSDDDEDGGGAAGGGWFGGGGGGGGSTRGRGGTADADDEEQEGGLIERKWEQDGPLDHTVERARDSRPQAPYSSWSLTLRRALSSTSSSLGHARTESTHFVAVPSSSPYLDAPFVPPTRSAGGHQASQFDDSGAQRRYLEELEEGHEKGWAWGTAGRQEDHLEKHRGNGGKAPRGAVLLDDDDVEGRGDGLTSGWRWATRKYRPKTSVRSKASTVRRKAGVLGSLGSFGSGRSNRLHARLHDDEMPPSPSIYSPTFEGAYDGLEEGEEDLDVGGSSTEGALDRYLGESRVGNGDLAKRFLAGKMTGEDYALGRQGSRASATRYTDDDGRYTDAGPGAVVDERPDRGGGFRMAVELPSAPVRSHVSPTKTAVLRPTSSATPPRGGPLIFAHATSPPPPAIILTQPSRPTSRDLLQLQLDVSHLEEGDSQAEERRLARSITFVSPTTSPQRLLFSPVGNASPTFLPEQARASESTSALAGLQDLVFGGRDVVVDRKSKQDDGEQRRAASKQGQEKAKPAKLQTARRAPAAQPATTISRHTSRPDIAAPLQISAPILISRTEPRQQTARPVPAAVVAASATIVASATPPPQATTPSRVRAAINEVEAREALTPPASPSPRLGYRTPSSPTVRSSTATTPRTARPLSVASIARANKLATSAAAAAPTAEEAENARIGRLLLQRRSTQSVVDIAPLSPTPSEAITPPRAKAARAKSRSAETTPVRPPRRPVQAQAPITRVIVAPTAAPALSNDPRRLSGLLRKSADDMAPVSRAAPPQSTAEDSPSRIIHGVGSGAGGGEAGGARIAGAAGGGGLEAMLRKSVVGEPRALKSAMKH